MAIKLDLYTDLLEPGARFANGLSAGIRAIYVRAGTARLSRRGTAAALAENTAWFSEEGVDVVAGPDGAELLRWEVAAAAPGGGGAAAGEGVRSALTLSSGLDLDFHGGGGGGYLLRCDRVDFPPGGEALLHTHQGPGTRCLVRGGFMVETRGHRTDLAPGEAWFEAGPDPVYARASEDGDASFVRVMILPRELEGKSSIRYVRDEDRDRPKSQAYQVFLDEEIGL